jgi:hypothetical protein
MVAYRPRRTPVQAPRNRVRGLVLIVMAILATLATVTPAVAGVGPGPWPQ